MKKLNVKKIIDLVIASSFYLPINFAYAQQEHNHHEEYMHDHGDNPIVTKVMFNQLEWRDVDNENSTVIDAQAWVGKDLDKFWLKADLEKQNGETEDAELQALYSRAIAPYWDLQLGVRKDIKPTPTETWGVLGVQGLAPYFFEVDAAFFMGESGRVAARFSAEYDLLFTQRLILSPEIEINLYGQNDEEKIMGSGLADANAGLRLRYEVLREFAPYIGINWNKKFGSTANFARANKQTVSNTEWVVGIRVWF